MCSGNATVGSNPTLSAGSRRQAPLAAVTRLASTFAPVGGFRSSLASPAAVLSY